MPNLGVAVPEDDGYDSVVGHDPTGLSERPRDHFVVVRGCAVIGRGCFLSTKAFNNDFLVLLLHAIWICREGEPGLNGSESALEPHVEQIRGI